MITIDFSELDIRDIDGKKIPNEPVVKSLANAIYILTRDISLLDVALTLNKKPKVALTEEQVNNIIALIDSEQAGFYAYIRKALTDFISSKK